MKRRTRKPVLHGGRSYLCNPFINQDAQIDELLSRGIPAFLEIRDTQCSVKNEGTHPSTISYTIPYHSRYKAHLIC